ncbi:AraC family transcriptional regulator [uncultured Bacteroides sp.]|uniref:AraC family transcriptional regulator n=1 Tax=uncultured Bacteroides sp. TaxID=162156 RepID=UPI0026085A2D|nr:AraC family transcriptional regulator [uncultured Bacteroides sp.]
MRRVHLQLIIGILLTIVTAPTRANGLPDSIYTLKHVMKIHINQGDSALKLLDVMEERKLEKPCLINAQRCLVYSQKGLQQMVLNYGQKALQDTALQNRKLYYLQTMTCVASACQRLEDYEQSIRYLTEGVRFSRETGHKQTEADFLFTMGENYYAMNQKKEAHNYFTQALLLLEGEKEFRMKPTLSYFYGQLTNYLAKEQRLEEAIAICKKREELIEQMKKQKGVPQGYIDQQLGALHIKQAYLYAQTGDTRRAVEQFAQFSETRYSQSPEAQINVMAYQLSMKQYSQLADRYRKEDPADLVPDTISQAFIGILNNLSEAYRGMNQYKEVLQYQQRIRVIEDSLNVRNQQEKSLELATIYKLQEKEWFIRQKDEQLHNSLIIQSLLGCAFALAIVSLWLAIRHINTIRKKNQLMAKKLDALVSCEEELDKLRRQMEEMIERQEAERQAKGKENKEATQQEEDTKPKEVTKDEEREENEEREESREDIEESSLNKDLFRKMERLIKDEKLYLNPELSRQDMLERLSIDKNRFGQMLQENTNMSFSQYLTDLRLKHALTELKNHPNYTIQAISEESGFANTRNFQRLFKAAFDMTPSEYKKFIQEQQRVEPPTD